jgi:hypothetical protein
MVVGGGKGIFLTPCGLAEFKVTGNLDKYDVRNVDAGAACSTGKRPGNEQQA